MVMVHRLAFAVLLVACGAPHRGSDQIVDADHRVDDAAVVPECFRGATILLDVNTPFSNTEIRDIVIRDNALYVAGDDVMVFDPTTGTLQNQVADTNLPTLWDAPDAIYTSSFQSNHGSIWRITSPTDPAVEIVSDRPLPGAVTGDGTHVYWNEGSSVLRTTLTGDPIETVMTACTSAARLFVDGTSLYCVQHGGHVLRGTSDGSILTPVDLTPDAPTSPTFYTVSTAAIDNGHMYVPTWRPTTQTTSAPTSELWDVPLPDGPGTAFFTDQSATAPNAITGLALSPDAYYVVTANAIKRIDRTSHLETPTVTPLNTSPDPVLWHDQLFFVDSDGIFSAHVVKHCFL